MSTASPDVYDLILASPYAGNWKTYGQGAEHNFFTKQARPEPIPEAPTPPTSALGVIGTPSVPSLSDSLGGSSGIGGGMGAATGPGNGSFSDIGVGPSVSGDPSIDGGAPSVGPSYAGHGPSYADMAGMVGMANSALGMVGMPSLPGLGLGLSAIASFADYEAAKSDLAEKGIDHSALSYSKGLANAALPGPLAGLFGVERSSFADQVADMEVSHANAMGPSLAQSLADAASYAQNFGPTFADFSASASDAGGVGPSGGATSAAAGGMGGFEMGDEGSAATEGASTNSSSGIGADSGSGAGGNGSSVICTELHRQGRLSTALWRSSQKYGLRLARTEPNAYRGYHVWARPIVALMRRSPALSRVMQAMGRPWARQMAYLVGDAEHGDRVGAIILTAGLALSRACGSTKQEGRACAMT